MRINEVLQEPVSVKQNASGSWVADFGRDAYGWLEVEIPYQPQETWVAVGEVLGENGRVTVQPGGFRCGIVIDVMTEPGERQWYPVRLPKHASPYQGEQHSKVLPPENCLYEIAPFRYGEVWGTMPDGLPPKFRRHAFFAPFNDEAADFRCSDESLNQVWDFCKYTIKATTAFGIYIDGERERQAFEGDAYINALGHYCCDADFRLARRTLDFLIEFYPIALAEYRLLQPVMVRDYLLYSGDDSLLQYWLPELQEHLMLEYTGEDGLFHQKSLPVYPDAISTLVDWPPWNRDNFEYGDTNLVCNAFLYGALQAMAEITGDKVYAEKAAGVRLAIRKNFLKNGHFTDHPGTSHSSFHADMFALRFGLAEAGEIPAIMAGLVSRGMACSVYGAQFLLEDCYGFGESQHGLELMRSREQRSWQDMMKQGATITMESWGNWDKPNQDWCHAWGAAPANIIPRHLCGIRPLKPGFAEFIVDPQPGSLESFSFRHPTIHGAICLEKHPDGSYDLTVPEGTTAIYGGRKLTAGNHHLG